MSKKRIVSILLTACMIALLLSTGCGSAQTPASTAAPAPASAAPAPAPASAAPQATSEKPAEAEYNWKIGLQTGPGDLTYEAMELFCKTLEEKSNGRIKTELYGGTLGDWRDVIEGLSFGMCDIFMESVGTLDAWAPSANIDAIPYLYSGYDHFIKVWSSEFGEEMRETIGKEGGFKLMGSMYRGARITTSKKPMKTLEDFKGFKLRAPNIQVYLETWKRLGATPTPLAMTETFTAIQQGTVEGQENSLLDSYNFAFYDVCKYVIKTKHVYSQHVFIMDRGKYEALPADIQQIVNDAAWVASDYKNKGMVKAEAEYEEKFKEKGCEIIEVDIPSFMKVFDGFVEDIFPKLVPWATKIREMKP